MHVSEILPGLTSAERSREQDTSRSPNVPRVSQKGERERGGAHARIGGERFLDRADTIASEV